MLKKVDSTYYLKLLYDVSSLCSTQNDNTPAMVFGGGPSCLTVPPEFTSDKYVIGCNYRPKDIRFNYHYLNDPLSVCWMYKNSVDPMRSSLILSDVICNFHLFYQSQRPFFWP